MLKHGILIAMYIARTGLQKILLTLIVVGALLIVSYRWWVPRVDALYLLLPLWHDKAITTVARPVTLADTTANGTAYSLAPLTLRAPWHDQSKLDVIPAYSITARFGPLQGDHYARTLIVLKDPSLREGLAEGEPAMERFFNTQLPTSADIYDYLMHVTPQDVHLFSFGGDPYREALLLLFKDRMLISGGAISSFTTHSGVRGYFSHKNASTTVAEFFLPDDQEYTLILSGANDGELAAVLQSLGK